MRKMMTNHQMWWIPYFQNPFGHFFEWHHLNHPMFERFVPNKFHQLCEPNSNAWGENWVKACQSIQLSWGWRDEINQLGWQIASKIESLGTGPGAVACAALVVESPSQHSTWFAKAADAFEQQYIIYIIIYIYVYIHIVYHMHIICIYIYTYVRGAPLGYISFVPWELSYVQFTFRFIYMHVHNSTLGMY